MEGQLNPDFSDLAKKIKLQEHEILNFPEFQNPLAYLHTASDSDSDSDTNDENSLTDSFGVDSTDDELTGSPLPEIEDLNSIEAAIKEANEYKEEGNRCVKIKKWEEAAEFYTLAIAKYNLDHVYFANRALCYLKQEKYEEAEADCTKAIEIDYRYIKAYSRRAEARKFLNNHCGAGHDLQSIVILEPNNAIVRSDFIKLRSQFLP